MYIINGTCMLQSVWILMVDCSQVKSHYTPCICGDVKSIWCLWSNPKIHRLHMESSISHYTLIPRPHQLSITCSTKKSLAQVSFLVYFAEWTGCVSCIVQPTTRSMLDCPHAQLNPSYHPIYPDTRPFPTYLYMYCKWQKAGHGLGTRLQPLCFGSTYVGSVSCFGLLCSFSGVPYLLTFMHLLQV